MNILEKLDRMCSLCYTISCVSHVKEEWVEEYKSLRKELHEEVKLSDLQVFNVGRGATGFVIPYAHQDDMFAVLGGVDNTIIITF